MRWPIASFIRAYALAPDDDVASALSRADALWRALGGGADPHGAPFSAAHEVAWLLLDEVGLAPAESEDDEEHELVRRLRMFMALVPDVDAWVRYLGGVPSDPAHAAWRAWRVARARRARLHHGAVHPDAASLRAPDDDPVAPFVRGHLLGPVMCLVCRRRRDAVRAPLAASGGAVLVELEGRVVDAQGDAHAIVLRAVDDEGWLRVHVDAVDPGARIEGRWSLLLHGDEARYAGVLELPAQRWHGLNLGRLLEGGAGAIHRVELHRVAEPPG